MSPEALNHTLFDALNATAAGPGVVAALKALAEIPIFALPVLVAAAWLLGTRADREAAVLASLAGCLSMALAHVASVLVDHPRPFMIGLAPNLLDHPADSSFPSDHATLFFALAVMFGRRPLRNLPALPWWLAGLGLAVGLARVALGVHFPLDILGATAIGAVGAVATDIVLRRPGALLFTLGERLRRFVGPLATRDGREADAEIHAHPSR